MPDDYSNSRTDCSLCSETVGRLCRASRTTGHYDTGSRRQPPSLQGTLKRPISVQEPASRHVASPDRMWPVHRKHGICGANGTIRRYGSAYGGSPLRFERLGAVESTFRGSHAWFQPSCRGCRVCLRKGHFRVNFREPLYAAAGRERRRHGIRYHSRRAGVSRSSMPAHRARKGRIVVDPPL